MDSSSPDFFFFSGKMHCNANTNSVCYAEGHVSNPSDLTWDSWKIPDGDGYSPAKNNQNPTTSEVQLYCKQYNYGTRKQNI